MVIRVSGYKNHKDYKLNSYQIKKLEEEGFTDLFILAHVKEIDPSTLGYAEKVTLINDGVNRVG